MSVLLADIDATCAALGYFDGIKYHAEPDALQGLKHLIWILRRDLDNFEYRRHLGQSKVLQTDLVPMLTDFINDEEYADVLIRLLVILTNPTLLLYRDGIPKDNHGRKIYLELIDILQGYKEGFASQYIWAALGTKLYKVFETNWSLRSEEDGLLIERILVLIRNVLQVPANPAKECRADNDASQHDQIIWALHQSGMLDLILYVLSSSDENQYHLHALEILCLLYREQTAESLADASLQRSAIEKERDERELITARQREKQKSVARSTSGRHSRFGGTYVIRNFKSTSDNDMICHQPLQRAISIDFDFKKTKQKRNFRIVKEEKNLERRSAFSIRLCLREYCIEILRSAYNTLVRQVRRILERNSDSGSHDDSYLLWAIRFFMEFNRLNGLQLHLVSESLSVQCFHWVLVRMQHHMDMITSDKKQAVLWSRRLHVAIKTFRELLVSLLALQKLKDDKAHSLFDMLLNNVCYVLEYRETILHLLMNYNESHSTKVFLRDVVETVNIFMKMMKNFCTDSAVIVQEKAKLRRKSSNKKKKILKTLKNDNNVEVLEDKWVGLSSEIAELLANDFTSSLPEEHQPIPFDAASEKDIDDQKNDCMLRIFNFLRDEKLKHSIILLRSARDVWPENDCFGSPTATPEDELMLLREIYLSNLKADVKADNDDDEGDGDGDNDQGQQFDNEEFDDGDEPNYFEKDLRFEDIAKRLVNPKIVRACTIVLSDWEKIPTKSLKASVTILHRIAIGCCSPAMLYQIALFRIFQRALNEPRDEHNEELRRLAIYIIRKFVQTAPTNRKIYAELFFYKSIREANELETGYVENYSVGAKGAWTEEQEYELRALFEENQNNPQNDIDVIDWMLENLIDKTRTHRGVLKKLRELGLIFKAPTKKSTAAAKKNLWQREEDEQLESLYDQYRIDENCFQRILEVFGEKRSKQNIIKRMIELHLIADKSEILPAKKRKNHNDNNESLSSTEDDGDNNEIMVASEKKSMKITARSNKKKHTKNKKSETRKIIKTPLDVKIVRKLLNEIDEKYNEAIDWLKEAISDAAEDAEETAATDTEDGIPILPLTEVQKDAIENLEFTKILLSLGIQPPIQEMETYWRIPTYLTATDLMFRVKILNGEDVHNDEMLADNEDDNLSNEEKSSESDNNDGNDDDDNDSESEVDYLETLINNRQKKLESLVFDKSDNINPENSSSHKELKQKQKYEKNVIKTGKKFNYEISSNDDDDDDDINNDNNKTSQHNRNVVQTKRKKKSKWNIDDMVIGNSDKIENEIRNSNGVAGASDDDILMMENNTDEFDINSENLRLRLAELTDDDDADIDNDSHAGTDQNVKQSQLENAIDDGNNDVIKSNLKGRPRRRYKIFDSDSESSADEIEAINTHTHSQTNDDHHSKSSDKASDEEEQNVIDKKMKTTATKTDVEQNNHQHDSFSIISKENQQNPLNNVSTKISSENELLPINSHKNIAQDNNEMLIDSKNDTDTDDDSVRSNEDRKLNSTHKHKQSIDHHVVVHSVENNFNVRVIGLRENNQFSIDERENSLKRKRNDNDNDDDDDNDEKNAKENAKFVNNQKSRRRRLAILDDDDEDDVNV